MNNSDYTNSLVAALESGNLAPAPLFKLSPNDKIVTLDLSENNPAISELQNYDVSVLTQYISGAISHLGGTIGVGGYLEKRVWYQRSELFGKDGSGIPAEDKRCIHLGIDFWTNEGTPVFLPFDGEIVTAINNSVHLDYGPTVIVRHRLENFLFHTLFGHLSLESIKNLSPGQSIKAGEKLAKLGSDLINGGWPPHLHFQIIIDLPNLSGDYPGVGAAKDLEFFKINCPDPYPFSGLRY